MPQFLPSFDDHRACVGLTESFLQSPDRIIGLGRTRKLKAGEALFHRGDDTDQLYIVTRGRIRTEAAGSLQSFGPGDMVGELCLCRVRARQEDATATSAAEVVVISADALVREVNKDPAFARAVLETLCHRLTGARAAAGQGQLTPMTQRIAARLLELALTEGVPDGDARILTRRPTHATLANAALASRERTSKVLAQLRKAGAIDYGRSGPMSVFPQRLRRFANNPTAL